MKKARVARADRRRPGPYHSHSFPRSPILIETIPSVKSIFTLKPKSLKAIRPILRSDVLSGLTSGASGQSRFARESVFDGLRFIPKLTLGAFSKLDCNTSLTLSPIFQNDTIPTKQNKQTRSGKETSWQEAPIVIPRK